MSITKLEYKSNKMNQIEFQVFAYTKRQQIMSDDNCLDAAGRDGPVKLVRCHGMGGNQAWNYSDEVGILKFERICSSKEYNF